MTNNWEIEYDEQFSPQIMNDDVCSECRINFTKLKAFIQDLLNQEKEEMLHKQLLGLLRETNEIITKLRLDLEELKRRI